MALRTRRKHPDPAGSLGGDSQAKGIFGRKFDNARSSSRSARAGVERFFGNQCQRVVIVSSHVRLQAKTLQHVIHRWKEGVLGQNTRALTSNAR
jgi:hypothetical protein